MGAVPNLYTPKLEAWHASLLPKLVAVNAAVSSCSRVAPLGWVSGLAFSVRVWGLVLGLRVLGLKVLGLRVLGLRVLGLRVEAFRVVGL